MKKIVVIIALMIGVSQIFAQNEQGAQKIKTKSNIRNDRDVEVAGENARMHSDITISKITIHIDSDENGNEFISIPTSPETTMLTLDTQTQTYKAVRGKIKNGQGSGDKRMHKPFAISKELDKKFKRTSDENGDIDVSDLEAGNYELKIANNADGIKFYVDENHRTYARGRMATSSISLR